MRRRSLTGLALSDKIPFFASYGAFCALRNADQLRISVAYNEANVKIGGGHAGISVGPDGATHQVLEEVALPAYASEHDDDRSGRLPGSTQGDYCYG